MAHPWDEMSRDMLINYLRRDHFIYDVIIALMEQTDKQEYSLIEFGCGTGALYDKIKTKCAVSIREYMGVDITPKVVDICHTMFADDSYAFFQVGSVLEKCWENNQVDMVIAKDLFEHLDKYEEAIKNALHVAKYYAILAFFNVTERVTCINPITEGYYFNSYQLDELISLFNDNGWKIKEKKVFFELADAAKNGAIKRNTELGKLQTGVPAVFLLSRQVSSW